MLLRNNIILYFFFFVIVGRWLLLNVLEIMILYIYLVDSLLILYEYLFEIFFFSLYFGPP